MNEYLLSALKLLTLCLLLAWAMNSVVMYHKLIDDLPSRRIYMILAVGSILFFVWGVRAW